MTKCASLNAAETALRDPYSRFHPLVWKPPGGMFFLSPGLNGHFPSLDPRRFLGAFLDKASTYDILTTCRRVFLADLLRFSIVFSRGAKPRAMQVLSNNHRVLFTLDKASSSALRLALDRSPAAPESRIGILRAGGEEKGWILFVFQGEPIAAATYHSGEIRPLGLEECWKQVESQRIPGSFFDTNPVFFKVMLVLVRCQPSVVGNGQVINLETLLDGIERTGKEQVLLLKKGRDINLFYFRAGKLVDGYFADPERNGSEVSGLSEALLLYAFEPGAPVEIRLFDDVRVDREADSSPPAALEEVPAPAFPLPVLEVQTEGAPIQRLIDKDIFTIGRGSHNDCMIDDPSVSREHARIVRSPDGYYVEDLKSRNGTFVDGRRIFKEKLADGGQIRIGAIEVRFRSPLEPIPVPDAQVGTAAQIGTKEIVEDRKEAPPVTWILEVVEGNDKGMVFALERGKKMSLGRVKVDFLINDPKISRHHADIQWVDSGLVFQDLQSKNGSFINEERVSQGLLTSGDLLRLGETVLKVTNRT